MEEEYPEEYAGPEPDYDDFSNEQQALIKGRVQKIMRQMKGKEQEKEYEIGKKERELAMIKHKYGEKPPKQEPAPPPKQAAKEEKNEQESQIMGKYLFRDIPLFKYEIILYIIFAVIAFMMYVLDRIGLVPGILSKMVIPAIILPIGLWFVKWLLYMPRKKKVPGLRVYKSGVIELRVEDLSKGYIEYKSKQGIQRKYITKVSKHTEATTGKPFIITSEIHGENLSLIEGNKPDMRSEEFNAILETNTAVTTKNVMNKMLKSMQPSLQNPVFMLVLITLMMVAVLIIKEFGFLNFIKGG